MINEDSCLSPEIPTLTERQADGWINRQAGTDEQAGRQMTGKQMTDRQTDEPLLCKCVKGQLDHLKTYRYSLVLELLKVPAMHEWQMALES